MIVTVIIFTIFNVFAIGFLTAVVFYIVKVVLALIWTLASAAWFNGGAISEFLAAFYISGFIVKVYQTFSSIGGAIAEKIITFFVRSEIEFLDD